MSTILITGVSKGLGKACALHLLAQGHSVIGVGQTKPEFQPEFPNENFSFFPCDLTSSEAVKILSKDLAQNFTIDMFVHNAMFTPGHKPFLRASEEEFTKAHHVCTIAPLLLLQRLALGMRSRNFGRIIFMGSAITTTGSQGQLIYLTAKSALEGLTKALALELSHPQVTANLLLLGPMKTEKFDSNVSQEAQEMIKNQIPGGEMIRPEEVAAWLDFFLTKESHIMNGASLHLSAGSHLSGKMGKGGKG